MMPPQQVSFLLDRAGVSSRTQALAGEMIASLEALAQTNEGILARMQWPNKRGDLRDIFTQRDIRRVFRLLAEIAEDMGRNDAESLRQFVEREASILELTDTLSAFEESDAASRLARQVGNLDALLEELPREIQQQAESAGVSREATEAILSVKEVVADAFETRAGQRQALRQYATDHSMASSAFRVAFCAQEALGEESFTTVQRRGLTRSLARVGWMFAPTSRSLLDAARLILGRGMDNSPQMVGLAERICMMFDRRVSWKHRQALAEIWDTVEKTYFDKVPRFTAEAMETVNPFLVRPLFRSFTAAKVYAAGGKIASSLETIWGTTLEVLFVVMGEGARGVGNGGIDVVLGRDAFDVKSGPAVMNNDQVNVLDIKQRIIQQEQLVPSLDTFRVALAYGKEGQIFGTMSGHVQSGDILPAREAWHVVTGDELAPEKVYSLCGLVADVIGVPDTLEAAAGADSEESDSRPVNQDDEEAFEALLTSSFDPPAGDDTDEDLEGLKALRAEIQGLVT